ncbi:unnamed protein product [Spirodela intermedia]|uniref:Uncharacterized protein n=1 Tax=Spirodela intermedia TaxID=51605 RepID=A0A7I8IA34_SPIIN|nr:unnamed protein product [Spirodela intermedia]CAA6654263.1 unnamed protein product [Spirodela intermedia]
MSGVWVFKNGVVRLVENEQPRTARRKVLLHIPQKLLALGWERYHEDPDLLQFHRRPSIDLISLPKDFSNFRSMYMYDIVVKNRGAFKVIDT